MTINIMLQLFQYYLLTFNRVLSNQMLKENAKKRRENGEKKGKKGEKTAKKR